MVVGERMAGASENYFAMAAEAAEHRTSARFQANIPVGLFTSEGFTQARIVDISVGGFACQIQCAARPGSRCRVDIPALGERDVEIIVNEGGILRCAFHQAIEETAVQSLLELYR